MGNTDYFFAMPDFLSGVGRVLDLSGTLPGYDVGMTSEEADRKALESDFKAVGDDIKKAMRAYDARK